MSIALSTAACKVPPRANAYPCNNALLLSAILVFPDCVVQDIAQEVVNVKLRVIDCVMCVLKKRLFLSKVTAQYHSHYL